MTRTKLSVNVNKIALLRNSRGSDRPGVFAAVKTCIVAGCHGITVHPRPDERHIRRIDVDEIVSLLRQDHSGIEFNIEGYPSQEWLDMVCRVRPDQATLVPDAPGQLTSDHGFDLAGGRYGWLVGVVRRLKEHGIRVSLFLDPVLEQVTRAAETGADRIELYTEAFARAFPTDQRDVIYKDYHAAAARAAEVGLGLNAGHDLNLDNLAYFARHTPGLLEVSIGHAIICDALDMGLSRTIAAYLACLKRD